MIKRLLIFTLCIALLFVLSLSIHSYFVPETMAYKLWQVYLFHFIATTIVYVSMEAMSTFLPTQAGYAYLFLMLIKIGIFVLIFKNSVFEKEALSVAERFGLVVPLFLFLLAEAIGVAKLLNNK